MQILFLQLRSYTKFLIFKRLNFEIFAPKGLTRVNRSFHAGDPKPYLENISSGIKGLLEDFEKLYMFLRPLQIFGQLRSKSFSRPFWLPSKSTYDSMIYDSIIYHIMVYPVLVIQKYHSNWLFRIQIGSQIRELSLMERWGT